MTNRALTSILPGPRAAATDPAARSGAATPNRPASREIDWPLCTAIARAHGRTFFLATRVLPPDRRRAIHAVYAYCRIADDIADRTPDRARAAAALAAWERQLDAPTDPVAVAFAAVRDRYGVPTAAARDLVAGVRMDLSPVSFATWEDLRLYCYRVAGTVGLMVAPILGCRDDGALPHAIDLGIAMQLTNILRDVGEDARAGRMYLPLADLDAFDCDPAALRAARSCPGFADLMAFEIARARALYASARQGFPALSPSGRLAAVAGCELYAAILSRIEAMDYDVFSARARVSGARKLGALPRITAAFAQATPPPAAFRGAR